MAQSPEDLIKNRIFAPIESKDEIQSIFRHFRGKALGNFEGDLRPLLEDPNGVIPVDPCDVHKAKKYVTSSPPRRWLDSIANPSPLNPCKSP
jgi:hypothetical protein